MAEETLTVDAAVDELTFRCTGSRDASARIDATCRWALDAAQRRALLETNLQALETVQTITTVNGTAEYAAADDFVEVLPTGLRFSTTPFTRLFRLSREEYDRYQFPSMTGRGRPTHYLILKRSSTTSAAQWRLHPTPNAVYTIFAHYRAKPTPIRATARGDAALFDRRIPSEYLLELVEGAMLYMTNYINNEQRNVAAANFADCLKRMKRHAVMATGENVNPDPMSNYYRSGVTNDEDLVVS